MIQVLIDNPILLLFVIVAIGYPLGRIRVAGSGLGVAAVLFAGLAVSALDPRLRLPEIVYSFGLALFVYTLGLSNGPAFFASFRRQGLRDALLIGGALALAAALTVGTRQLLGLDPLLAVGVFAGSLTNTPALASALEYVRHAAPGAGLDERLAAPVVGYSVTYPMGVVGTMLALVVAQRWWRVDYGREAQGLRDQALANQPLRSRSIRVMRRDAAAQTIQQLMEAQRWDVVFGRVKRAGRLTLATGATRLQPGDVITLIGREEELDRATAYLGEASAERLELDRSAVDFRRIFVSDPKVAGHSLRALDLVSQFGAVVTRVRRGDVEFLPRGDTVLELGDRVRVLARRENLGAVSAFLGDSYRALSEIDVLTFSLGLAGGVLVGLVPLPLPGGLTVRLGLGGGPLVVALLLGARERTGPLVWTLPYSANLTLRQLGLILFLAGVGTRAGHEFVTTLAQGGGLALFVAGAAITGATTLAALWAGYRLLGIPLGVVAGMVAGLQTQPAVLSFALERTDNDLPNKGYASVYPLATIGKIVLAQLLLMALGGSGGGPTPPALLP